MDGNFDKAANVPKNPIFIDIFKEHYLEALNPQSKHILGSHSKELVNKSKKLFMNHFSKFGYESIEFLSGGGSNANKRAILGSLPIKPKYSATTGSSGRKNRRDVIVISSIEHKSIDKIIVGELVGFRNYGVIKAAVTPNGIIDMEQFQKIIDQFGERIALVSVILVNNETGIIQPICDVVNCVKSYDVHNEIIIHSDIAQGIFMFDILAEIPNPDIVSFSSYKFGGPSLGIVIYNSNVMLNYDYFGTPDVLSIYGSAVIFNEIISSCKKENDLIVKNELNEKINLLFEELGIRFINFGTNTPTTTNILSYLLPEFQGEMIQKMLSAEGICIGTGSACSTNSKIGSDVIKAMGYSNNISFSLIRFSFDINNLNSINILVKNLKNIMLLLKETINVTKTFDKKNNSKVINDLITKPESYHFIESNANTKTDNGIKRLTLPIDIELPIVRYNSIRIAVGELYLKGGNKKRYTYQLLKNIENSMQLDEKWRIIIKSNYLLIITEEQMYNDEINDIIEKLLYVTGISKITPCYTYLNKKAKKNHIETAIYISKIFENKLEELGKPVKYKINFQIKGLRDRIFEGYKKYEWDCIMGQYIADRYKENAIVNLTNPDIVINVNVFSDIIHIFFKSYRGFQGLPWSSSGEMICIMDKLNCNKSGESCKRMIGRGMKIILIINENDKNDDIMKKIINEVSKYQVKNDIEFISFNNIIQYAKKITMPIIWEPNDNFKNNTEKLIGIERIKKFEVDNNLLLINSVMLEPNHFTDGIKTNTNQNNTVIMLISGGIDSPVASFKLKQTGFKIPIYLHFSSGIDKIDNIKKIKSIIDPVQKLFIVNFKEIQEEIVRSLGKRDKYRTLIYKVFMVIIANKLADEHNIAYIGSGNSLGQVASQTIDNLRVTRHVSRKPILSPLIGYCKDDIIKISKDIGTFEPSTCNNTYDCCVMYMPKNPVIKGSVNFVDKFLKKFNMELIKNVSITVI
jgi:adenylyl- and sulfurtransferase ThiI/cysteine sulfinate desulfinase/cysteine desulfurase-like protein